MEDILAWFALAGTAVFAVSGAMVGLRKSMDVVGVSFVATLTGVGGGTLRDLLLGGRAGWLGRPARRYRYLPVGRGAGLHVQHATDRPPCAMAALCRRGRHRAVRRAGRRQGGGRGRPPIGRRPVRCDERGILRDIVCGEPPVLFRREIYVSAALLGGAVFILLPAETGFDIRAICGLVAALLLRLCAIRWQWTLPFPNYREPAT